MNLPSKFGSLEVEKEEMKEKYVYQLAKKKELIKSKIMHKNKIKRICE